MIASLDEFRPFTEHDKAYIDKLLPFDFRHDTDYGIFI